MAGLKFSERANSLLAQLLMMKWAGANPWRSEAERKRDQSWKQLALKSKSAICALFCVGGRSMSKEQISMVVRIRPPAEARDEFKAALSALVEPSREEPGCLRYELYRVSTMKGTSS
jgi:hypothetical protein